MMGRQSVPADSLDPFRLDDYVPADHLLRQLDAVLHLDRVRTVLAKYYSYTGRPSIDPELMLRMLLIGYAYGIRSERRLCREVHLNLSGWTKILSHFAKPECRGEDARFAQGFAWAQ